MSLRLAILLCAVGLFATVLIFRGNAPETVVATGPTADTPPPAGTWQLAELAGEGLVSGPLLFLQEDGQVNGETGCNGFAGTWEAAEGHLGFGPLAMTRRACLDADAAARETAYLRALGAAAGYTLETGRLEFRDADGAALAVFAAVAESEPEIFACDDGSEVVAVYLASDPPYARLTRGAGGAMARRIVSASRPRYEGDGVAFLITGAEARVDWRGTKLACREK
jgi:heat shock protein HslJ